LAPDCFGSALKFFGMLRRKESAVKRFVGVCGVLSTEAAACRGEKSFAHRNEKKRDASKEVLPGEKFFAPTKQRLP
jgi:hypothetical protein